MPTATIATLARSVFERARDYGFTRLDQVRLASALLSLCNTQGPGSGRTCTAKSGTRDLVGRMTLPVGTGLPIRSTRLDLIALAPGDPGCAFVAGWLHEMFAAHFLLSAATAQPRDLESLMSCERNLFGMICLHDGRPIGVVAYLDRDELHRRAEVRALIGDASMRCQGYANEALRAWLSYGAGVLGLEKIFVQLIAGDVRSLRTFERLGFSIEAVLPDELSVAGVRHDAVRCGLVPGRHDKDRTLEVDRAEHDT